MKKEIPILFSTEMIKALLDGRKTMTRRIVKTKYGGEPVSTVKQPCSDDIYVAFSRPDDNKLIEAVKCPYGQPGDLLWVRESWCIVTNASKEDDNKLHYRASTGKNNFTWKPSIHMKKSAARIWLEVTEIRVERLQDINEFDAECEGIEDDEFLPLRFKQYGDNVGSCESAITSFQTLWEHINGPESWNSNPWVWVVSFKVVSKTGKP